MSPQTPPPSGSEYADHLKAVMEHAARADAERPPSRRASVLTRGPVIALLAIVFGAVVLWDVKALSRPVTPPAEPAHIAPSGMAVMAAVQGVETYRKQHGTLPASLSQAGIPDSAFDYSVSDGRYHIAAGRGNDRAEYRSEDGIGALLKQLHLPSAAGTGALSRKP